MGDYSISAASRDPYADVVTQQGPTRTYTVTPMQFTTLAVCVVITLFIAIGGSPWAAVGLIPIGYCVLGLHHRITCDEQGLIIHYWLMPPHRVPWAAIRMAQVSGTSQKWCVLTLHGMRLWVNVNFKVAGAGSWARYGDGDILLKTIMVRAGLTRQRRVLMTQFYSREDRA